MEHQSSMGAALPTSSSEMSAQTLAERETIGSSAAIASWPSDCPSGMSRRLLRSAGPRLLRDILGPTLAFYAGWRLSGNLVVGITLGTTFSLAAYRHERRHGRPGAITRLGGIGDRRREIDRIVVDAAHRQHLTRLVLVHDHRTAAMQIDPDVLSRHRGLLCRGFACGSPESQPLGFPRERRPRSVIASLSACGRGRASDPGVDHAS